MANNTEKKEQVLHVCPINAAYLLGRRHNVSELARKLGKSEVILANKLNPHQDSHVFSLREAVAITELTNDNGILEAWAHSRGLVLVPVPDGVACDEELSDQLLKLSEVMGQALGAVRAARADGVIDPVEFEQIKQQMFSVITESKALETVVGEQVRELKAV